MYDDFYLKFEDYFFSSVDSYLKGNDYLPLNDCIRYALSDGKRIRPMLTISAGIMFDNKLDDLLLIATAVELLHSYSLIHDDLPAMDDDDVRRGKPSCHIKIWRGYCYFSWRCFTYICFSHH